MDNEKKDGRFIILLVIALLFLVLLFFFRNDIKSFMYPNTTKTAENDSSVNTADTANSVTSATNPPESVVPVLAPPLPAAKIISDVPFTSQSPFGDWADLRQQHGCEEASLVMAHHWIIGGALTPSVSLAEILAMSKFEEKKFNGAYDISIADTLTLWREYYGYKKSFTKYDIGAQDIKAEIAADHLVIVPMNGTLLKNPNYTAPGPLRHELVVIGYDDGKQEFITNDPGTKFGRDYRYSYDVFVNGIRDYKTGLDLPIDKVVKAMLVIEKE